MQKFSIVFLPLLSCLLWTNTILSFENNDWQCWPRVSVEGKLSERWKIYMDEEFRIGENINHLYFHRTDLGLTLKLLQWFDVSLNYWHDYKESKKQWVEERRPHINFIFKWTLFNLKFNNRNRFEYRSPENKEDYWNYRNQLILTPPVTLPAYSTQPYLADEIFYDFKKDELTRNRIYFGFIFKPHKSIHYDFYYLLESNKDAGEWSKIHVIGTKVKFLF